MTKYRYLFILLASIAFLSCWIRGRELLAEEGPLAVKQDLAMLANRLGGIKAVYVKARDMDGKLLKRIGISMEQITTDVELKLQLAGIDLANKEDWADDISHDSVGRLFIVIDSFEYSQIKGIMTFNVSLELSRRLCFRSDVARSTEAILWKKSLLGIGDVDYDSGKFIREKLGDLANKFASDYLRVNQKEK